MNPAVLSTSRILAAMVLYGILCAALLWWRPSAMFDADMRPRQFGVEGIEQNQSIFAPVIVFPILAVITFASVVYIDLLRPAIPRAIKPE